MPLITDLEANVDQIIKAKWGKRNGRVVPESDENVKFIHDAVASTPRFYMPIRWRAPTSPMQTPSAYA